MHVNNNNNNNTFYCCLLQDIIGNRLGRIDETVEPSTQSEIQQEETPDDTQAAIFYSISSTQPGK